MKARRARNRGGEKATGGLHGPPSPPFPALLAFLLPLLWAPCEPLGLLKMRPVNLCGSLRGWQGERRRREVMSFGSLGFWRKRRLTASPRLQHLQTRSNVAQTNEADKQWMVLAELARRQKQSGVELAFRLDRFWLSTEEGKAYLLIAGSPIPHNTSRYRTNF